MKVGVVQIEPKLYERERNLEVCLRWAREGGRAGCELLVFPECSLSGYMFDSAEEALPCAEEIPGAATEAMADLCRRFGLHCVLGMLERSGDTLYNAAALIGPDGLLGRYRKTHLPYLGVDRFVEAGDRLAVFETPVGKLGVAICYDLRFPEVARALTLEGAEIIVQPTNWSEEARTRAEVFTLARPLENHVFLLTANRFGSERGAVFFGWSQIVDPAGRRLAEAGEREACLVTADIELAAAQAKAEIYRPGEYELRTFEDRRPDLYGALARGVEVVQ